MIPHRPHHWLAVIAVLLTALLTWREVRGGMAAAEAPAVQAAPAVPGDDRRQAGPDKGVARDEGSTTRRALRSAKRTVQRVRDKLVAIVG